MAYASFHQEEPLKKNDITDGGLSQGKAIAKIYGYMGIGLLITGVIAFLMSWLFYSEITRWLNSGLDKAENMLTGWVWAILISWIVSLIGVLVLSFVIPIRVARGKGGLWAPYILYCVFMGILLTAVLLSGVQFYIIGEAFGITAVLFAGMFAIGWFSKKDLSILSYIAMALLLGILAVAITGIIMFAVGGMSLETFNWLDLGITAAMIVVILLITCVDTYRIKQIVANSGESRDIYLFCAYVMYGDFIALLIRVIYLLAKLQGRNN